MPPNAVKLLFLSSAAAVIAACSVEAGSTSAPEALTLEETQIVSDQPDWLYAFYETRNFKPIWTDTRRNRSRLKDYLAVLSNADRYGLNPDNYNYSWLRANARRGASATSRDIEFEASRSFAALARDIRDGQINPQIDMTEEELKGRQLAADELLASFAANPKPESFFASLRRDNPVQAALTKALDRYEGYVREGGWEPVTLHANKLEVGSRGDDVVAIAKRLRAEGFFSDLVKTAPAGGDEAAGDKREPVYSEALADAVSRFQESRGIVPDGIVGPETLARLNEPAEQLVDSIRLNMERARWLPQDFSERYILVNIARYTVGLYENERLVDEMRAVVGKYHQQTPVFAGSMSYVVVNPYWNVPISITRDEIAPQAAKDPDYLKKKNFEVVRGWGDNEEVIDASDIDWDDLPDAPDFRVRQTPGPQNSLGYVKFMFPNDYNVYLHDTPADSLFEETDRAFSHGCIRLEDPKRMASWVFKDADNKDDIDTLIEKGERTQISLEREIPVYVTYFTAWAGADGDVYFLPDVYDRDQRIAAAIDNAHTRPAGGPVAVAQ